MAHRSDRAHPLAVFRRVGKRSPELARHRSNCAALPMLLACPDAERGQAATNLLVSEDYGMTTVFTYFAIAAVSAVVIVAALVFFFTRTPG